jgi:hypothetical protein
MTMSPAKRTSGRQAVVRRKRNGQGYLTIGAATAELIEDPLQVLEWDDEELRKGHRRNSRGSFGEAPTIIPRIVYEELVRRTIDTCLETMRENMPAMVEVLVKIATDEGIDAKDRIKAIDLMMNRIFGKPKERVQVEFGKNERPLWEKALDVAVVNSSDEEPFE